MMKYHEDVERNLDARYYHDVIKIALRNGKRGPRSFASMLRVDSCLDATVDRHQRIEVDRDSESIHLDRLVFHLHRHMNNNGHHIELEHNFHSVSMINDDQSFEELRLDKVRQHKLFTSLEVHILTTDVHSNFLPQFAFSSGADSKPDIVIPVDVTHQHFDSDFEH